MKWLGVFLVVSVMSATSWAGGVLVEAIPKKLKDEKLIEVISLRNGMTLYIFDPDQADKSNCNGGCAEKWPPVLLTEAEIASLPSLTELTNIQLSVITRQSGLKQLAINNRPVYTFFSDRVTNDTTGDGAGGVWHAIKIGQD